MVLGMDRASSIIKMVVCMMETGSKIKCKDMESCIINQVLFFIILGKIAYEG